MRTRAPTTPITATTASNGYSTSPASKSVASTKPTRNGTAIFVAKHGLPVTGADNFVFKGTAPDKAKGRLKKEKKIRYSCRLPKSEFAALQELKDRLAILEISVKKSDLIRSGLQLLAALPERRLKTEIAKILGLKY